MITRRRLTRGFGSAAPLLVAFLACDAQRSPATPPTRPYVVVANQRTGEATLVEVASGRVSHVDLGARPHEVAVAPDGRLALLTIPSDAFRASRRAIVLDLATARMARTIELGELREPHGVAFISDSVALVGSLGGTSLVYVDVRNGRVLRTVDGFRENPYIVALTATGRAYVSSPHSGAVAEVDVAGGRILRRFENIPDDPAGITVSRDGRELYAAIWREGGGGGIVVYDLEKAAVTARLPATQPRRMTVTSDQKLLVVTDRSDLRIVDRATRQIRSVPLGRDAYGSGVACSPDSTRCYVALSRAGEIVEVDVSAGRVTRRFAARPGVDGVAYVSP